MKYEISIITFPLNLHSNSIGFSCDPNWFQVLFGCSLFFVIANEILGFTFGGVSVSKFL
jgi:hypothetical protein